MCRKHRVWLRSFLRETNKKLSFQRTDRHMLLDVYHTSTHGVALVRISNAGLKCAALGSLKQDAKIAKNSLSGHHRTSLSGCIFVRQVSTIGKKVLNSNIFSTCPHNMANYGPLAAEIGSGVWGTGTPANFNGFRVLAALLHGM